LAGKGSGRRRAALDVDHHHRRTPGFDQLPDDIFVSKLSSKQKKHQLDLRVLALKLDKDVAKRRLLTDGRRFLDDTKLRPQIDENWRFIFQEPLCPQQTAKRATDGGSVDLKQKGAAANGGRPKRPGRKEGEVE